MTSLMKDYVRKQKCDVLDGFLSFLMKYENEKNPWHAISNVRPKI
jgi:hypothetical protein